jgi:hypothetical protein
MIQVASSMIRSIPNVVYHPDAHLLTWHQVGALDDEMADRMVEFMEYQERDIGEPFNRYVDSGELLEIRLTFGHTFHLAERRRVRYTGPPVKTAFFASWVMALGLARLYAEFMRGSPVDVRVFERREDAAEWLNVPLSLLLPKRREGAGLNVNVG